VYTFRTSPTKKTGFVPFALPEFPFYSDPQLETSIPFEGPLFVDVNGDSQVDMVYSRTISSSNSSGGQSNITAQKTQYVALNTGEGFAYTYRCRYYFSLYNSLQTETYSGDCAAD
ncbi:MAG: hypothetical protein Q8P12_03870, partial [bacterium]|nr:hypothetical protein [bacterium]